MAGVALHAPCLPASPPPPPLPPRPHFILFAQWLFEQPSGTRNILLARHHDGAAQVPVPAVAGLALYRLH